MREPGRSIEVFRRATLHIMLWPVQIRHVKMDPKPGYWESDTVRIYDIPNAIR